MGPVSAFPKQPPLRSSLERGKVLRRVRVIACGIEVDIPSEGETSVKAVMRAVVALAFPERRTRAAHCCLFLGDKALPETTRVAELPPDTVLHLHFVADGLGTAVTHSEDRESTTYAGTFPSMYCGAFRKSTSPMVLSPLDTIQLQQRGSSYDGPHMMHRMDSEPSRASPIPNPLWWNGRGRRAMGLAALNKPGALSNTEAGARASLPPSTNSYPRLRREYSTTTYSSDHRAPEDKRISVTVALRKQNANEDKGNSKVDDHLVTSLTSTNCGSSATSCDGTVAYRRLRVQSDYPVGTLREFFGVTPDYCIYLGETAIRDDRAPLGSLQGASTQTFSFRRDTSQRPEVGLSVADANVRHGKSAKERAEGNATKENTFRDSGSIHLVSGGGEMHHRVCRQSSRLDVEEMKENGQRKKQTNSVNIGAGGVEYMKLRAVPLSVVNTSEGSRQEEGGVSGYNHQAKHEKRLTAERPDSDSETDSSDGASNNGNATADSDSLNATMPFESPSKSRRSDPLVEPPLSQTHPRPGGDPNVLLCRENDWVRAEGMGGNPLNDCKPLPFGAGAGSRLGGDRAASGDVQKLVRPHSLAPIATPQDTWGLAEGKRSQHFGARTSASALPSRREGGTVVVPLPPPRPVEVLKEDASTRNHHTLAPLSGVAPPVSILSCGLMQKHRRTVVGGAPVIVVEEQQQQNTDSTSCETSGPAASAEKKMGGP